MEPRIQYAQTADGVSIAFCTLGDGMPLVHMPTIPLSNIQREWRLPSWRSWYERLAGKRKLVRYDGRGSGVSDRDVVDFSLDAHILDLEAITERLGLERFGLWAAHNAGPVAIAYAARHPERVSHLILWLAWARATDWARSPKLRVLRGLLDRDWEAYTETWAHIAVGWSAGEEAHRYAALMRESAAPEAFRASLGQMREFDVSALLPQVRSPTLVLHRRQVSWVDLGVARELASRIPDARLALLEGESSAAYLEDTEAVLAAIDEFLGEEGAAGAAPAGLVTILFTEMEGSRC